MGDENFLKSTDPDKATVTEYYITLKCPKAIIESCNPPDVSNVLHRNQAVIYYRPTRRATGGCNWRRTKISEKYTSYANNEYQTGFYRSKTK